MQGLTRDGGNQILRALFSGWPVTNIQRYVFGKEAIPNTKSIHCVFPQLIVLYRENQNKTGYEKRLNDQDMGFQPYARRTQC
jgi:hypothetical protein